MIMKDGKGVELTIYWKVKEKALVLNTIEEKNVRRFDEVQQRPKVTEITMNGVKLSEIQRRGRLVNTEKSTLS